MSEFGKVFSMTVLGQPNWMAIRLSKGNALVIVLLLKQDLLLSVFPHTPIDCYVWEEPQKEREGWNMNEFNLNLIASCLEYCYYYRITTHRIR